MFLHSQAELALGSRFKAVSESLYAIANDAYREAGVEFEAHAFPILRYLQVKGRAPVTQVADAIGQTHSAVSQAAARLHREGWITRKADRRDARRSVLDLSEAGQKRLGGLGPLWCAIRRGAKTAADHGGASLLDALAALEAQCANGRVADEIRRQHARLRAAQAAVSPYREEWREHFLRINAEWLERDFEIEDIDRQVLSEPQTHVLDPGGAIWFAHVDGEVIGTCALINYGAGEYELSKMGVASGWRGMGAGRLLIDAAIRGFLKRRGKQLFLESNSVLAPALALYQSAGFVRQATRRPGSHYRRSDVYMIFDPEAAKARNSAIVSTRKR